MTKIWNKMTKRKSKKRYRSVKTGARPSKNQRDSTYFGSNRYRKVLKYKRPRSLASVLNSLRDSIEAEIDTKTVQQTITANRIGETTALHRRYIQTRVDSINRDKVCGNRRKRREIMFAKRKAGKGIKVSKVRKYTEKSKVRC